MEKKCGKTGRRRRLIRIGIAAEAAGICAVILFGAHTKDKTAGAETDGYRYENTWDAGEAADPADAYQNGEAGRTVSETLSADGYWYEEADGAISGALSTDAGWYGEAEETAGGKKDYITWVDFNVTADAMRCALQYDLDTYGSNCHIDWIVLLAYAGCRGGGTFSAKSSGYIRDLAERIKNNETMVEKLSNELSYFDYYYEAYSAVLGGYVGEYEIGRQAEDGSAVMERVYGVKVFSPIAKGFAYSDYDDFGASRSYGYRRPHLGHDMLGVIGTPIVAVESGYVEALGWNRYGGWRIGIRSFDGRRYYYYAHLRQNYPYAEGLAEGSVVTAGDVIGYMGHTGYSTTENVNNIETVHLHWGLQLIFDESQKDGNNEIWVDCYALTNFLSGYRSAVEKVGDTREWVRSVPMNDPAAETYVEEHPVE
ncbi:MAG: M23 family metallopeptidase [bacterium]|nr:M23 family metallopeptidase [bacterium]